MQEKQEKKKSIMRISKDKENPYAMINKNVLHNENLSWKARGIIGYLLSLPDDWNLYTEELERHSNKDGRESLASGIKELINNGYIIREQARTERGSFGAWNYTVLESPVLVETVKPESGLSESGQPATTNTHPTNTDLTKKINNKKKKIEKTDKKSKYEKFYL